MRYALTALLVVFNIIGATAQRHQAFADVGVPAGFSITYNYKFARHWSTGIGAQGYKFFPTDFNYKYSVKPFVPGIFADIRFTARPQKRGQLFSFLDLGM